MTHNTNTTFPESSDSPGLRQLLFKSHDCGLQLMELINEAVLHLQENKKINANKLNSHTWPGLILSYLLPREIMRFINLKPHLGTGPCRVCWSCSPVVCEPVSGRPSWPGDLHPARGCRPPSLPFHLRSTGRCSKPSGTSQRNKKSVHCSSKDTMSPSYFSYLPLQLAARLLFVMSALAKSKLRGPRLGVQLVLHL